MKYSFNAKELNNWKANIGQRLVECYIKNEVIPTFRREGWDDVIFTSIWFAPKFSFMEKMESKFFITNGLHPTPKFLHRFEQLTNLLENSPDGYLIKLKRTGKFKYLKNAISELKLDSWKSWSFGDCRFSRSEHDDKEKLSIVDGDIEIIEIKLGKSFISPNQRRSYSNVIKSGFLLYYFHVDVISFEKNDFEIKEKRIENIAEFNKLIKSTKGY